MEYLRVNVSTDNLFISTSGKITGHVFLDFDKTSFPEEGWIDFVVVVLSWWIDEVLSICVSSQKSSVCSFMDGPFELHIKVDEGDLWQFIFVEETASGKIIHNDFKSSSRLFINSLLGSSDEVLKSCGDNGWTSVELDVLLESYKSLLNLRGRE